jgi:hypothetical protein
MSRQASITALRRYSRIGWSASLLLTACGGGFLLLFIRPALVGVDPGSTSSYEGKVVWLCFGALFVFLGVVFQVIAYRWPRRLLWVLRTRQAKPMRLHVELEEDSENTQYYARLSDEAARAHPQGWRVGLWAPSREVRSLIGSELSVRVYLDPQTAQPAVIEYADGYLWAMKGAATPQSAPDSPGA